MRLRPIRARTLRQTSHHSAPTPCLRTSGTACAAKALRHWRPSCAGAASLQPRMARRRPAHRRRAQALLHQAVRLLHSVRGAGVDERQRQILLHLRARDARRFAGALPTGAVHAYSVRHRMRCLLEAGLGALPMQTTLPKSVPGPAASAHARRLAIRRSPTYQCCAQY